MLSWILILTLISGNGYTSVTHYYFASKDTCQQTGKIWVKENTIHNNNSLYPYIQANFICTQPNLPKL